MGFLFKLYSHLILGHVLENLLLLHLLLGRLELLVGILLLLLLLWVLTYVAKLEGLNRLWDIDALRLLLDKIGV